MYVMDDSSILVSGNNAVSERSKKDRAWQYDQQSETLPPKWREGAGDLIRRRSLSFMRGLLAGDSGGGGENSRASVGPPECSCCRSSHRDTHRNTSLQTFCRMVTQYVIFHKADYSCPGHTRAYNRQLNHTTGDC